MNDERNRIRKYLLGSKDIIMPLEINMKFFIVYTIISCVLLLYGNAWGAGVLPQHPPPDGFRGVKWNATLPSVSELTKTALHGCITIVDLENFSYKSPCIHAHIDTDDIDVFAQHKNISPFFGVRVSEQDFAWSYGKFWSGNIYIRNFTEAELSKLRTALINRFGQPTSENNNTHQVEWNWPDDHVSIQFYFENAVPLAKPNPAITVTFTRTE